MTKDLPPPLDFNALRAKGIAAAQDASGKVWTDYNLHDPGVTLLEQTVFALTEVAFIGDHAVRDLLTDADSGFSPDTLALFGPDTVLQGRPVTRADLASYLSDLPQIERVFVRNGPAAGLVDLIVIPHDAIDPADRALRSQASWRTDLIATLRAGFAENRLLTTDINRIDVATAQPVRLYGEIAIGPFAEAERVIAETIHQVRLLLKGLPPDLTDINGVIGATRADVFDNVNALLPTLAADANDATRFEAILATLRQIAGVEAISGFAIVTADTGLPVSHKTHGPEIYHDPIIPGPNDPMTLVATRGGTKVVADPNTIHEELGRIDAARIAGQGNRKNDDDWDVLRPGRHRDTTRAPLDIALPEPYRVSRTADKAGRQTLPRYRSMMDTHLDSMRAPIAVLHQTYGLTHAIDLSDPAAVRHRIEVLDYLISLQGDEMPVTDPSYMQAYRGIKDRLAWQVNWRQTYLANLPFYNHFGGTGHTSFGFAARLAHLADMAVGTPDDLTAGQDDMLRLDATLAVPAPTLDPAQVILPSRPLDVFIARTDDVPGLSLQKLALSCPWIVDRTTTPALLQQATRPEAYSLARNRKSDWEVLFEPVAGGHLYPCGSNQSRARVEVWANRVRKSFASMNQSAERLWLIEDVLLRATSTDFAPATATVLLPDWTARTADPAYRSYVEDLVLRLAPAHLYVKPQWLAWHEMDALRPAIADWKSGKTGAGPALRAALRAIAADQTA
ncbi:hypothetical protein [Yoonia sp.]|uniref:hypothetical protein n=1 Tax=Yoonia sp. TaxID=2212373 RepID=UPI0025DC0591|nr:hypothetical protein [Yoonia sp.]